MALAENAPTQERAPGIPPPRDPEELSKYKAQKLAKLAGAHQRFSEAQEAGQARSKVWRDAYDIIYPSEAHSSAVANILLTDATVVRGVIKKFADTYKGQPIGQLGPSAMIDLGAVVLDLIRGEIPGGGQEIPIADIALISREPIPLELRAD